MASILSRPQFVNSSFEISIQVVKQVYDYSLLLLGYFCINYYSSIVFVSFESPKNYFSRDHWELHHRSGSVYHGVITLCLPLPLVATAECNIIYFHDDVIKWKHFPRYWPFVRGNSPVRGEFLTQRPVKRSFDVFLDLRLNKRLSKQSWGWWFEMLSRP